MPNPTHLASPHTLPEIPGYTLVEQLYLGSRTAVYRAGQTAQQQSVVIKVMRSEYPSISELVQFRNQYTITKNLPIPGIVQPISLESLGSGYALVMEDWGGVSLSKYVQQKSLDWTEVLAIALQLAEILHDLHQHRIIHKDIKPANILIHPQSKQAKLIDFSIASLLPKETQKIQSPTVLEGTLAYLSPEQTGRMNRDIDYRADFYALGVTLYQLLSGKLPFESDEPMELVHCHIAQVPVPVDQVNPAVPVMVAAIVAKLMAKNAEDRYQSGMGLKHDLEQCLTQWQETGAIGEFQLGSRDLSDRFLIPEKLYGREAEVQTLLEAFERVAQGSSEMMLVAGFSGIGKTAVVNEVHKPITRQNGYFIKGKFDQFNRNIPLSAFVQALRDLMGQLLSESDAQLAQWKVEVVTALGDNGQVLIDVIPELEQIIGQQPSAPELSGTAAQNRFNLLFQKFIGVFTSADHPLVLFLDDLQWADSASLQLIKLLMNDNGYLLMLGAYRDNEVSPAHPLMLTIEELRKAKAIVNTITLTPLGIEHMNHLIADTLHCNQELARPLTQLINLKTQGNPFFTTQFLKALHEDGDITFNRNRCYWECDITQVNALTLTDDVVEFMAVQLQKLPQDTRRVLQLAACMGNQFDLVTLAIVCEQSPMDTATALWKALQEGLIVPTNQIYKFFQAEETGTFDAQKANPVYRFLHDRIQQAAYALIPEENKHTNHFHIGYQLLENLPAVEQDRQLFEIVSQLNRGIPLITDLKEQKQLADLNLKAGRKAKDSIAYSTAMHYFQTGIQLLSTEGWKSAYELTRNLYEEAAEAALVNGEFDRMESWIQTVLHQATSLLEKMKVYEVRLQAYQVQGQQLQAIEMGRTVLQQLGVNIPDSAMLSDIQYQVEKTLSSLEDRKIEDLLALPAMTDAQALAAMRMLTSLVPSVHQAAPYLFPLLACEEVNLSLQYGNAPLSAPGYADFGIVVSTILNRPEVGYQFGQLALSLTDSLEAKSVQSMTGFKVAAFILWNQDLVQRTIALLQDSYIVGLETGDSIHGPISMVFQLLYAFLSSAETLNELYEKVRCYESDFEAATNFVSWSKILGQTISNLTHIKERPELLVGECCDEESTFSTLLKNNDELGIHLFFLTKLILSYWFNCLPSALDAANQGMQYLKGGAGMLSIPIFYYYDALTRLAAYPSNNSSQQPLLLQADESQNKLRSWAKLAPANFLHQLNLVEAERHRILGNKIEAIEYYDLAIAHAKANRFIQDEALANELAARFYLDWDKEKVAAGYMKEAYYCYTRWGAKAKTDDLESRYPQLLQPILQQANQPLTTLETLASITAPVYAISATSGKSSSTSSVNHTLDLAVLLKTSQILASTIELDALLQTLTQTMLENSGADHCMLILAQDNQWQVRVQADLELVTLQSVPLENNPTVPVKLIQYVKNTLTTVVIDELNTHLPVVGDYLAHCRPKSVLGLPILNQGTLVGILYLENRATSGVFTTDRLLVLNFLCTQAAISIQNSVLYQKVQDSAKNLELSLQESQQKSQDLAESVALYQGQQRILALIAQGSPLNTILKETAQYIEAHTHHPAVCSFLLLEEGRLRHAAAPSLPEAYNALIDNISIGPAVGSCGTAAYCKASVTVEDIATDPLWVNFHIALDYGLRACASTPVLGDEGQVLATLAMYQPEPGKFTLHDRKLMEVATYLARIAIERHQTDTELQKLNLQIIQTEKMASLGNLVAGVAHEINNPIGFLNGSINNAEDYIQDLLDYVTLYQHHHPNAAAPVQDKAEEIDLEFLRDDLPKLLNSMKGATDRIKSISTSLRTFSRADTEYKVQANLHEGIDSAILILKYRLKANEFRPAIQVIQDYGELPTIDCFPGQLNQVFMNILANAIDMFDEMAQTQSFAELEANPQRITIQTALTDRNAIEIRIRDNGKGMTEDVKTRIFDHLFTTKGVGKGTGLGLAIARQIVTENHRGSLEVQSEWGQGSEFCIHLPIL